MSALSVFILKRLAKNLFLHHVLKRKVLEPVNPRLYVTNRCNLDCHYCDDGTGNKYNPQKLDILDTAKMKQLLGLIREKCSWISLSGGEPLLRKDMGELLRYMREDLRYELIIMATNGVFLKEHEEVLDYVDHLGISLDTTDTLRWAAIIDASEKVAENIIKTIETYAKEQKKRNFKLIINCVIFPDKVQDAEKVFQFCKEVGASFSAMPQITGKVPHKGFSENKEYRVFLQKLKKEKSEGVRIINSFACLEVLESFSPVACYPSLVPDIYADGTFYFPCSPLEKPVGNLLDYASWDEAVQAGKEKYGDYTGCEHTCHISCYLEPSLLIQQSPWGLFKELRSLLR